MQKLENKTAAQQKQKGYNLKIGEDRSWRKKVKIQEWENEVMTAKI